MTLLSWSWKSLLPVVPMRFGIIPSPLYQVPGLSRIQIHGRGLQIFSSRAVWVRMLQKFFDRHGHSDCEWPGRKRSSLKILTRRTWWLGSRPTSTREPRANVIVTISWDVRGGGRDPRKQQEFCTTVKLTQTKTKKCALDLGVYFMITASGTRFPYYILLSTIRWARRNGNLLPVVQIEPKNAFETWKSENGVRSQDIYPRPPRLHLL